MADFEQTIDWPAWVLVHPDVLYAAKTRLLAAMHGAVQRIADQASGEVPFESVKDSFFVGDEFSGSMLVVGVGNDAPHWPFVEEDMPAHDVPPVEAPIAPFIAWVDQNALEVSPFYARDKVAAVGFHHPGTTGKHILEAAWNDGAADLENSIDETYAQLMETWGAI